MPIQDDFSVDPNGDIRYTGTVNNYTVIELHRFLQDLADNASSAGDDILDITDNTPSDRSTDNIITLLDPYNIDDVAAEHLFDGSITQAAGDVVYSGLVVVGSVPAGTQLQIVQNNTLLTNYWTTGINTDPAANILLRLMVKTRDGGADIDGQRVRVQARELGDTYAEFSATLGLGNGTAAIFTAVDLNNQTDAATIAGWAISNSEGLQEIDVNGNGTTEQYYSQWDRGTQSINDLYEYTKWVQRSGTAETIYGISGDLFRGITHSVSYDALGGAFIQNEIVTFGNGATGLVLADDGISELYIQLLTGTAPANDDSITGATAGATVNGAAVARTVSPAFIGASTGSAIIGAFGVGVEATDLTNADQLFDLSNTLQIPPNFIQFTVGGLVAGEDYVLVGPESNGGIDESQLTANGAHVVADVTFTVNEVIPTDTPASGSIRVFDGVTFVKVTYASYSGSVFTLTGTLGIDVVDGANTFISYLDTVAGDISERFTSVFASTRSLFIRVRDGGITPIRTFETTGSLSAAGGSTTAIRTTDQ